MDVTQHAHKKGNVLMTPMYFLSASTGPYGRAVPAEWVPRNKNARLVLHRAMIRNIKTFSQRMPWLPERTKYIMILGKARGESPSRLPKSLRFRKSFLLPDRPAAVRLNGFIHLRHQANRGRQRRQDFEIVGKYLRRSVGTRTGGRIKHQVAQISGRLVDILAVRPMHLRAELLDGADIGEFGVGHGGTPLKS